MANHNGESRIGQLIGTQLDGVLSRVANGGTWGWTNFEMHAVIFDIDGTLLRSNAVDDALYEDAVRSILGRVSIRRSLTDYEHVSDAGILAQILSDNAIPDDPEISEAVRSLFVESLRTYISECGPFPEIPGASDRLRQLHSSSNHCVAIATGGWRFVAVESALGGLDSYDVTDEV